MPIVSIQPNKLLQLHLFYLNAYIFYLFQLPDLRYLDCRVDYSKKTFGAVVNLCKDLGIRHPEELSLCKPLEAAHLKRNFSEFPKRKLPINEQNGYGKEYIHPAADTNSFIPTHSNNFNGSNGSLDNHSNGGPFSCAPVNNHHTLQRPANITPISSPTGVSMRAHLLRLDISF